MGENIIVVNEANWDSEVINSKIPVLVDFWATWCGPCKSLSPILEQLAIELNGKVKIVGVDIENDMDLAKKYSVRSVPTLIVFVNGEKKADKMIGLMKKDIIKSILEKYIEKGN